MTESTAPAVEEEAVRLSVADVCEAPGLVGKTFRTAWFKVDPEKPAEFDRATYTNQNEHGVDESAYPDDLLEGFHLVSLLDHLVNDVVFVSGSWVAWNYGMDKVRFINPTRVRDRWRIHGVVSDVVERSGGFLMHLDLKSEIEGQDKPGFVVQSLVLWRSGQDESGRVAQAGATHRDLDRATTSLVVDQ